MENKKKPDLKFPEFSKVVWKQKKLGDLYDFKPTNSFTRDMLNYEEGNVKNIHYGDIHTKFKSLFDINNESVPYINRNINIEKISCENYIQEGDLILADASEDFNDIGKSIEVINLNNEKILSGLHTILARRKSDKDLSIGFACYLMKTHKVRLKIKKIAQGTKILGLSTKRLSDIPIYLPIIEEQKKIVYFLSAIDKRIDLLSMQKEKLEKYKRGIIRKIFSHELRFKDNEGKEFPEWEVRKLKEITSIYDGTHQTPKYVEDGVPFYSVEHVTANQFSDTKYISEEVFVKENNRVKLEKGDILMTRIGSIGVAKHIDWEVKASFYVSLALIKKNESFNSAFLSYLINGEEFQRELWKRTIHVAFPKKINLGEIGECNLKLPILCEQNKISSILINIDKQIDAVGLQILSLKEWENGLLQKMFI